MITWEKLAAGVYGAEANGHKLRVQFTVWWKVVIDDEMRMEIYEEKDSAQEAAERFAYL